MYSLGLLVLVTNTRALPNAKVSRMENENLSQECKVESKQPLTWPEEGVKPPGFLLLPSLPRDLRQPISQNGWLLLTELLISCWGTFYTQATLVSTIPPSCFCPSVSVAPFTGHNPKVNFLSLPGCPASCLARFSSCMAT